MARCIPYDGWLRGIKEDRKILNMITKEKEIDSAQYEKTFTGWGIGRLANGKIERRIKRFWIIEEIMKKVSCNH